MIKYGELATVLRMRKSCSPGPFFLIRIASGVARYVAGAEYSRDMFHDADLIAEEIC